MPRLSDEMLEALNKQIQSEFASAYLYLAMSCWFEDRNLPGFGYWMRKQFEEEQEHALKILDYVQDRDGTVDLRDIPKPVRTFTTPLEVFEQALSHEEHVTRELAAIYDLANKESDYPTQALMQWFAQEQVEEEKTVGDIVERLKLVGDSTTALLSLDRHLVRRE